MVVGFNPLDFWQYYYDSLAYHFPLTDPQPVLRIPITGPAPYNTLAVLRTIAPLGPTQWATGDLRRTTFDIKTDLNLMGYRPDRPEQQTVHHSSSATIRMMQIAEGDGPHLGDWNTTWVYAVDRVHPESKIDEDGNWIVTVDSASAIDGRLAVGSCEISSWVMFWEGE